MVETSSLLDTLTSQGQLKVERENLNLISYLVILNRVKTEL